jgi:hypothetical protein
LIKIEKATKGLYVLNQYEKGNFEKMICECNNDFNIEEAITLIHVVDKEMKVTAAKERMRLYVQTKCALCGSNVRKCCEDTPTPTMKDCVNHHVITIKGEDGVDNEHLICENCMKTTTTQVHGNNTLMCVICDKEHVVDGDTLMSPRKRMKSENGGCCNDKCIVC